jgi:hypothetical protein
LCLFAIPRRKQFLMEELLDHGWFMDSNFAWLAWWWNLLISLARGISSAGNCAIQVPKAANWCFQELLPL